MKRNENKTYRIVIAAGGTGGHLFPARSLAEELHEIFPEADIHFVGGGLAKSPYFNQSHYPFLDIPCGGASILGVPKIMAGIVKAFAFLIKFKPHLVVGFGSYHTFPLLVAAKTLGIPLVLHEANSVPGRVNRLFSPYATVTGIHFREAALQLRGKTQYVGLPLRKGYKRSDVTKEEARKHFGLDEAMFTILIFGGSQGAQAINRLFVESLDTLNTMAYQVIHCTGNTENVENILSEYKKRGVAAYVTQFETNMQLA